jgi:hypothetical protein
MTKAETRTTVLLGILMVLLSTNCNSIFAPDEGKLEGRVVNDVGEPVAGADVETDPFRGHVVTGPAGAFVFNDLSAGDYTLIASRPGYDSGSATASLPKTGGISCATPEATANTIVLTLEGWSTYEEGNLVAAISQFLVARDENPDCADAENGLGWTYARFDSLEDAVESFEAALTLDENLIDAWAGLALVSSARSDHEEAINSALQVLDVEGDDYVFRRDASVTSADLRLLLAQSYFYTGQYDLAQEQVDLLDPDNGLDPGDAGSWQVEGTPYDSYEEALLVEIQLLGQ